MYLIRLLVGADAAEYRALRLEALEHRPDLFSASYAEDQGLPVTRYQGAVAENQMFGGFRNEALEGVLSLAVRPSSRGATRPSSTDFTFAARTGRRIFPICS